MRQLPRAHAHACARARAAQSANSAADAAAFSSCSQYKEKHKEQLSDRLGAGTERDQLEYRKMLDEERNRKVELLSCSAPISVHTACSQRR